MDTISHSQGYQCTHDRLMQMLMPHLAATGVAAVMSQNTWAVVRCNGQKVGQSRVKFLLNYKAHRSDLEPVTFSLSNLSHRAVVRL